MGVGLGEELVGLLLGRGHGVGPGIQRTGGSSRAISCTRVRPSLAGSPPCWPFIAFQALMVCRVRSA